MLLATAILLVAVGVLNELAALGGRHARGAEDAAAAQRICSNLLDEILSGIRPLESAADATVDDEPDWTYTVEITPVDQLEWNPSLATVRVTVSPASGDGKPGKPFSLTRWVRYPTEMADKNDAASETPSSSEEGDSATEQRGRFGKPPTNGRPAAGGIRPSLQGGPQP
jgi:hypothetical protein